MADLGNEILEFLMNPPEEKADKPKDEEKKNDDWEEQLRKYLKKKQLGEQEIEKAVDQERTRRRKAAAEERRKEELETAREVAKYSDDADTKRQAKQKVFAMELQDSLTNALSAGLNAFNGLYDKITASAEMYGNLLGQIETRLLGSGKTYASVADMVSRAFAVSPFFSMEQVMKKTAEVISSGISYNVELRAALDVMSDKIASTFDAFDSSLVRLIKIQQQDSTQARLGMENMLNQFFNTQYRDTSYLNQLSKTVTASLLEAEATMGRNQASEFEYAAQMWLGSMSSVGVSDATVQKLAEGLGYLGSGNISGLNGNSQLEQLLVASANRGGGRSYGDILTNGATVEDINSIMTGLSSLVSEISNSGNIVALNQYAQVFGLTMSDLTSVLNLTNEDIGKITQSMLSYEDALKNFDKQSSFKSLYSRTSDQEIMDNLLSNLIGNAGQQISSSAGGYFAWKMAGMVNDFLDGMESGVDIQPFGVGTHLNLSLGDITKSITVMAGLASGLGTILTGISSLGGVNMSAFENVETVSRGGTGLSLIRSGTARSETTYQGDTSESSIYKTSNAAANTTASQMTDEDIDEEKENMKKTQESMNKIGDNVQYIVELLNVYGIVIRGRAGESPIQELWSDSGAGGFVNI